MNIDLLPEALRALKSRDGVDNPTLLKLPLGLKIAIVVVRLFNSTVITLAAVAVMLAWAFAVYRRSLRTDPPAPPPARRSAIAAYRGGVPDD